MQSFFRQKIIGILIAPLITLANRGYILCKHVVEIHLRKLYYSLLVVIRILEGYPPDILLAQIRPVAGGITIHECFEGNISSTRQISLSVTASTSKMASSTLLNYISQFSDDSPDGKYSVANYKAFQ
jgi:hypothetical protein